MKVLVVEPRGLPYEKEVPDKLENLQAIVGGHIQAIYPFQDHVALVCNEDGIGEGLEFNRMIPERQYGGIFGTFFICAIDGENFASLTPEQMKTYKKRFQKAEMILAVNRGNPLIAKVTATPKQPHDRLKQPPKNPKR
ncbi:MAG: DUF3846 domain-containing protein [Oscillospiraceae bacterium]|nr:DUF3846 domain-containing protein [Oscillospiraceae bacterium]